MQLGTPLRVVQRTRISQSLNGTSLFGIELQSSPNFQNGERATCLMKSFLKMETFSAVSALALSVFAGGLCQQEYGKGKVDHITSHIRSISKSHWFGHSYAVCLDQLVCSFDIIEPDFEKEDAAEDEVFLDDSLDEAIMFQVSAWVWGARRGKVHPSVIVLALLLLPVKDKPADAYQRLGVAEVPNYEGLAGKNWTMKEITII